MFIFENHGIVDKEYFSYGKFSRNRSFPAHVHRTYELVFVCSGSLNLQVDQKKYVINADELAFIFPKQIHSFHGKFDLEVLIFSPEIIYDFYHNFKYFAPVNNIITKPKWLNYDELKSIYSKKAALYSLCDLLLSTTKMEPIDRTSNVTALQQIFDYIGDHYGGNCCLKSTAEALQYDPTYLSKLFSKYTGISFTTYLNNYRIAQACTMLSITNMSVSEIADRCGYMNLRTFHRNFRKIMNCSPQVYQFGNVVE
ncbi:MAG: AraC family transcriptional regulator [Defluviitaleaceae bacterium]|nr:AraC family transcriptional regulator [Defluviitaleaceae bacterium]